MAQGKGLDKSNRHLILPMLARALLLLAFSSSLLTDLLATTKDKIILRKYIQTHIIEKGYFDSSEKISSFIDCWGYFSSLDNEIVSIINDRIQFQERFPLFQIPSQIISNYFRLSLISVWTIGL